MTRTKPKQPQVSVRGSTYARLRERAAREGVSVAKLVELAVADVAKEPQP